MPIFSPNTIPNLLIDLNPTRNKLCVQTQVRQLSLYTIARYSVEEDVVGCKPVAVICASLSVSIG
jgi:hypothetical protein